MQLTPRPGPRGYFSSTPEVRAIWTQQLTSLLRMLNTLTESEAVTRGNTGTSLEAADISKRERAFIVKEYAGSGARIIFHPDRLLQPYTVWKGELAHYFSETLEEAEVYCTRFNSRA